MDYWMTKSTNEREYHWLTKYTDKQCAVTLHNMAKFNIAQLYHENGRIIGCSFALEKGQAQKFHAFLRA